MNYLSKLTPEQKVELQQYKDLVWQQINETNAKKAASLARKANKIKRALNESIAVHRTVN